MTDLYLYFKYWFSIFMLNDIEISVKHIWFFFFLLSRTVFYQYKDQELQLFQRRKCGIEPTLLRSATDICFFHLSQSSLSISVLLCLFSQCCCIVFFNANAQFYAPKLQACGKPWGLFKCFEKVSYWVLCCDDEAVMMAFALPCCFDSIQLRFPGLYPLHNQISMWSHGLVSLSLFSLKFRFECTVYFWIAWQGHVRCLCLSEHSFWPKNFPKSHKININLYTVLHNNGKSTNTTATQMQMLLSVSCGLEL